jgi:hypothetical protein
MSDNSESSKSFYYASDGTRYELFNGTLPPGMTLAQTAERVRERILNLTIMYENRLDAVVEDVRCAVRERLEAEAEADECLDDTF